MSGRVFQYFLLNVRSLVYPNASSLSCKQITSLVYVHQNTSSLSCKQITSTLSLVEYVQWLEKHFLSYSLVFAVADTFSLHCFFLQSLIAVFLFLIDHACFKKSGMSIQKMNFFLQKNSLSVYVEQGKNVLVFDKLFLI